MGFSYSKMGSFKKLTLVLFTSLYFSSVYGQLDILSDDTVPRDTSFTVTCDASRVNLPADAINTVIRVQIDRQVGSSAESNVAIYRPSSPVFEFAEVKQIPAFRTWDITFSGGVGQDNRDTIRAVLRVNDSQCEDTGIYKCTVEIYLSDGTTAVVMQQQNLTVTAAIENHRVTAEPHNGNDQLASTYPSGSNVTLTCRIQGPANLQMVWRQRQQGLSIFTDYPVINDIAVMTPEPVQGGSTSCPQYNYMSTLNIIVEEPNQFTTFFPTVYQCVVREDGTFSPDISTANITLGIDTTPAGSASGSQGGGGSGAINPGGGETQPSTAGSDDDIGIIVGCVIGALALIVIVVLLVYFLWYRKRKQGDKEEGDRPDGTANPDLHAPPPVFYSKPSKPPKDDRDNDNTRDGDERTSKARYDDYGDDKGGYDRKPYYDNHYDDSHGSSGGRRGRRSTKNSSSSRYEDDNYPYANGRSYDGPHYASTDVSRSEDESVDQTSAPLDGGKPKPRPKRRSKVPHQDDRQRDEQLHYADLDLAPSRRGERDGRDRRTGGNRREADLPVEYAEIRV